MAGPIDVVDDERLLEAGVRSPLLALACLYESYVITHNNIYLDLAIRLMDEHRGSATRIYFASRFFERTGLESFRKIATSWSAKDWEMVITNPLTSSSLVNGLAGLLVIFNHVAHSCADKRALHLAEQAREKLLRRIQLCPAGLSWRENDDSLMSRWNYPEILNATDFGHGSAGIALALVTFSKSYDTLTILSNSVRRENALRNAMTGHWPTHSKKISSTSQLQRLRRNVRSGSPLGQFQNQSLIYGSSGIALARALAFSIEPDPCYGFDCKDALRLSDQSSTTDESPEIYERALVLLQAYTSFGDNSYLQRARSLASTSKTNISSNKTWLRWLYLNLKLVAQNYRFDLLPLDPYRRKDSDVAFPAPKNSIITILSVHFPGTIAWLSIWRKEVIHEFLKAHTNRDEESLLTMFITFVDEVVFKGEHAKDLAELFSLERTGLELLHSIDDKESFFICGTDTYERSRGLLALDDGELRKKKLLIRDHVCLTSVEKDWTSILDPRSRTLHKERLIALTESSSGQKVPGILTFVAFNGIVVQRKLTIPEIILYGFETPAIVDDVIREFTNMQATTAHGKLNEHITSIVKDFIHEGILIEKP
jgi:hypothetical protein